MREEGRRRGMREEASVTVFGSGSRAQLHGQPHRRGGWVIRPVCVELRVKTAAVSVQH